MRIDGRRQSMVRSRKSKSQDFLRALTNGIAEKKLQFSYFVSPVDCAAQAVLLKVQVVMPELRFRDVPGELCGVGNSPNGTYGIFSLSTGYVQIVVLFFPAPSFS